MIEVEGKAQCLTAAHERQAEAVVAAAYRYPTGQEIFIETSPWFDCDGRPTPLAKRAEHGSCGNVGCPFRHCLVEAHGSERERDQASASHESPSAVYRYHEDLDVGEVLAMDATPLRHFFNVQDLDAQHPAALAALRYLRRAGASAICLAQTRGDPHPSLLIFCEDIGEQIKAVDARLVKHASNSARAPKPPDADITGRVRFRHLHHASWRTMLGWLLSEAVVVYLCGQFVSWSLGPGAQALGDYVSLPMWLLALALTALVSVVGWMVWMHARSAVRLMHQRMITLREDFVRWVAELDARAVRRLAEGHTPECRTGHRPLNRPMDGRSGFVSTGTDQEVVGGYSDAKDALDGSLDA